MTLRLAVISVLATALVSGQVGAQSNNYTALEQQNLMVVQGFWNNVFMARNPDRAREYLAENYLEHNPAVPGSPNGGVAAFIQFLNMFRARAGGPGGAPGGGAAAAGGRGDGRGGAPASDVVLTSVDGDIVTMLRRQMALDPMTNQPYEAFGFEMFRVRDGRIVEHWDAARRLAPGQAPPGGGAPAQQPGRGQGAAPAGAPAQGQPQATQRSITQVRGDLYTARNNNHNTAFLVAAQGIILADPINAEFSEWLKGELAQRFPGRPVRFVLQSHHHFDHASGAGVFNDTAEIVAHANFSAELKKAAATLPGILRRLDQNNDNRIQQSEMQGGPLAGFFAFADRNRDGVVDAAEMYVDVQPPESTFTDRRRVTLGTATVEMIHPGPNHSFDAAVLHFPAQRAAFVVDYVTLRNRFPGGFDDGAPLTQWIAAIRAVEALDVDTILVGHGDVGTKADLTAYRQYVEALVTLVTDGVRANRTVEQLQADPALDRYKDWVNFPQGKNQNIADAYTLIRAAR